MNKRVLGALSSLLLLFILCSFMWPQQKLTIWMMGDSTMAIKAENKYPETGWGVPFAQQFKDYVTVVNTAKNGRSSKSFIREGLWDKVYQGAQPGDYVFIQFGHNDEKVDKPNVGSSIDEYKANLSLFVTSLRAKKVIPVLLTPIARRLFSGDSLQDTHKGYPKAVKAVADSLHVPLIDLTQLSSALLQKQGKDQSVGLFLHLAAGAPNYPNGVTDNTHLNTVGAQAISDLVVQDIRRQQLPLRNDLKY